MSKDWLLVLAGVLSVVFGVLVLLNPAGGALAIVRLIGIYELLFGITWVVFGLRLRSAGNISAPQKT